MMVQSSPISTARPNATARALIAVLIPTKNEQENLPFALDSVAGWAQQVFVLDSGSTDRTEAIAREKGAEFVFHAWEGYGTKELGAGPPADHDAMGLYSRRRRGDHTGTSR